MPRRRSQRYHQRQSSDDEFETPALQIAEERLPEAEPRPEGSDDDLQSESGLGESPEEDLIEDPPSDADIGGSHPDSEDSDSAPEEVSFAKAAEAEEKRQQTIKGALQKGRLEERERRRKRDELFKLQKKEKLATLNKRKLPDTLLEELTQVSEKKQKTDQGTTDSKEDNTASSSQEDEEEDEEEEEDFDSEEEEDGHAEEFIPLGDTPKDQVAVVSLKARKGQGQGTPFGQSVADFKHNMLFGRRHKRVTSQQAQMQQAKRLARR